MCFYRNIKSPFYTISCSRNSRFLGNSVAKETVKEKLCMKFLHATNSCKNDVYFS